MALLIKLGFPFLKTAQIFVLRDVESQKLTTFNTVQRKIETAMASSTIFWKKIVGKMKIPTLFWALSPAAALLRGPAATTLP